MKLEYKYVRKDLGCVTIKGFAGEKPPSAIEDLMESYGFIHDSGDDDHMVFVDLASPDGNDFYEEFLYVSWLAPVSITTIHTKKRKRQKVKYLVHIDGCSGLAHASLYVAFEKAYTKWHHLGRPVNGVYFKDALETLIESVA